MSGRGNGGRGDWVRGGRGGMAITGNEGVGPLGFERRAVRLVQQHADLWEVLAGSRGWGLGLIAIKRRRGVPGESRHACADGCGCDGSRPPQEGASRNL